MDDGADENTATSSSVRVIRHLETRELDCHLIILSRALLINKFKAANGITVTNLLAQNHWGLARLLHSARLRQGDVSALMPVNDTHLCACSETEWERVVILEVALRRDWLLFGSHVAQTYLDLFRKRGPLPHPLVGHVCVPEVEQIMWPSWIGTFRIPVFTDEGILEALPGGLSRPCYRCEEPPCRHCFLDVTLRTRLLQLATAVRKVLRKDMHSNCLCHRFRGALPCARHHFCINPGTYRLQDSFSSCAVFLSCLCWWRSCAW